MQIYFLCHQLFSTTWRIKESWKQQMKIASKWQERKYKHMCETGVCSQTNTVCQESVVCYSAHTDGGERREKGSWQCLWCFTLWVRGDLRQPTLVRASYSKNIISRLASAEVSLLLRCQQHTVNLYSCVPNLLDFLSTIKLIGHEMISRIGKKKRCHSVATNYILWIFAVVKYWLDWPHQASKS